LLPFDPTLSYWAMSIPEYEWQLETTAAAPSATTDPTGDACAESSAGVDPASDHPACPPPLRLVMTGMKWVVVPYWSPRENSYWNLLAEDAQDTDRQRNETNLRQSGRHVQGTAPADPEPDRGAAQ
jgi:hypothetical protein